MLDIMESPRRDKDDRFLPSVQDILQLPAVLEGDPQILTGQNQLDQLVRWVHVCEQPDMARFVDHHHLVLTSGMGLQREAAVWLPLFDLLADRGATGVFLELGVVFDGLPDEAISRAEERGLVVVVFPRPTRFVDITYSVHNVIQEAQLDELRRVNRVHETFTQLTWGGAGFDEIINNASHLLQCPVVAEDLANRVLSAATGHHDPEELLTQWAARSSRMTSAGRITFDAQSGALCVRLGSRGQSWGRLVALLSRPPVDTDHLIADRAAIALDLQRLIEADDQALELHSKRSLLNKIMTQSYSSVTSISATVEAAGVPIAGRALIGGTVKISARQVRATTLTALADQRSSLHIVSDALRFTNIPGLVADQTNGQISVMLSLDDETTIEDALTRFAQRVHHLASDKDRKADIAFGTVTESIDDVKRSCEEANHVAAVATDEDNLFHRLDDVRIHGLLHLLNNDSRLQNYTARQLSPLLSSKVVDSAELIQTLTVYLDQGRNKAATARELGISRPTFYARLDRIVKLLGIDIEQPQIAMSLQLALYARASVLRASR
ncbi:PucR family transcriptional regulator [Rhodococcus sp. NPDC059968]|uniref:PucR family transcriptional regulator n=1 Tax=Rhodococcus sp. NPDC059968 TaxID=3347017 RepID=UPI00366B1625